MFKTIPLPLENVQYSIIKLKRRFLETSKTTKFSNNIKEIVEISVNLRVYSWSTKKRALRMAKKTNMCCKKTFINFYNPQFETGPTKKIEML